MRYELVLLDLDDTIFDYEKTEEYALKQLFSKYAIDFSDKHVQIYSEINKELWDRYEKNAVTVDVLRTKRFEELLARINKTGYVDDIKKFSSEYLEFLSSEVFYEPYAKEIYGYLNEKYKIVFFTNGIHDTQKRRLRKAGMLDDDAILVSSELAKASKPSRIIFEYALNICDVFDKSRVILIGDNLNSDIKGADISKIKSIWYNRRGKKNTHDIKVDYEIRSLLEIRSIL